MIWPRRYQTPPLALVDEREWDPNPGTACHIKGADGRPHCGSEPEPGCGLCFGGSAVADCFECVVIERGALLWSEQQRGRG